MLLRIWERPHCKAQRMSRMTLILAAYTLCVPDTPALTPAPPHKQYGFPKHDAGTPSFRMRIEPSNLISRDRTAEDQKQAVSMLTLRRSHTYVEVVGARRHNRIERNN
jgi:hypothetical protein